MKRLIILSTIAIILSISMCSCSWNIDSKNSSSVQISTNFVSSVSEENSMIHSTIKDIEDLELSKINKISSYILDEEIFVSDDTVSEFTGIVKRLVSNDETDYPDEIRDLSGGWYQIKTYDGDTLLYTFTLSAGDMKDKIFRVDIENDKTYFLCNPDKDIAESFIEVYQKIYALHDLNIESKIK